jgi:hypothetical protein
MRLPHALATAGTSLVLVLGAGVGIAHAQDYPGGTTEERVDASQADRPSDVLGEVEGRTGAAVSPTAAQNGALAFTGGDVAGLGALGAGLVVGGTVLVRRSRSRRRPATA